MSNKWENSFLQIAKIISEHSTCIKKKVGALLVRDNRIISIGYNGTLPGEKHCENHFKEMKKVAPSNIFIDEHKEFSNTFEIHAEQNCIAYAAKHGIKTEGATLYITVRPCNDCAKLAIASGIKKVVYIDYGTELKGLKLLNKMGIEHYKGEII